jgi:purine-binding chemotaxis protein CheW
MTSNIAEDISDIRQYVTFCLADESFGVEVTRTREILNLSPITQVPQTPDYMLGVINLRGQVVPVVDMRLKLGLEVSKQTQNTCIIVVEILIEEETLVVGLLADAVNEVLDLQESQIEPPPRLGTKINTAFIQGMGQINDQLLILLEIDKVFNDDEVAIVSDLTKS